MKSPILFTDNAEQIVNISRRQFLKQFAVSGFVLAVGLPTLSFAEQKLYGVDAMPHGSVDNPLVFVAIAEDGTVTIVCHRSEMGQGIRTSLPMVVADELDADWQKVKIVQAPGDEARFGNQDTDGSRSMRHFFYANATSRRGGQTHVSQRSGCKMASWD